MAHLCGDKNDGISSAETNEETPSADQTKLEGEPNREEEPKQKPKRAKEAACDQAEGTGAGSWHPKHA
jgi:hypothetical protein